MVISHILHAGTLRLRIAFSKLHSVDKKMVFLRKCQALFCSDKAESFKENNPPAAHHCPPAGTAPAHPCPLHARYSVPSCSPSYPGLCLCHTIIPAFYQIKLYFNCNFIFVFSYNLPYLASGLQMIPLSFPLAVMNI